MNDTIQSDALEIAEDNYQEYSKYVIATRAYPGIYDGCKAVYRRTIYCCSKFLPDKLVKSVNAIGQIVQLHPHPNSIYGVIVQMASKYDCPFPLFDTKGNFGGFGHPASAERYTECKISNIAKEIFMKFTDYADMMKGETDKDEPRDLPALLPLCFLHGSSGIPVGMPVVNIPSLNAVDMIKYYIEVLKSEDLDKVPNYLVKPDIGNVIIKNTPDEWRDILRTGKGSIRVLPKIEIVDNRTLAIVGLSSKKKFDHVRAALSQELARDQIDIRDETSTEVRYVVEIPPYRRININEIKEKLEKKLSASESCRFIFADHGVATFCGFHDVVKHNLEYLIKCVRRKFDNEIKELEYQYAVLYAINKMKLTDFYKDMAKLDTNESVKYLIDNYDVTNEQAKSILRKPLSYIMTKDHDNEMIDIRKKLDMINSYNDDVYSYLIDIYKDLLKKTRVLLKDRKSSEFNKVRRRRNEK